MQNVTKPNASDRTLTWRKGKRHSVQPTIPCYHAHVEGGYYRVAPVTYHGHPEFGYAVLFEVFFIPTGAKTANEVRDIKEGLGNAEEAKALALEDYRSL